MGYKLAIDTGPGPRHPLLPYADRDKALRAAQNAIYTGFHQFSDVVIQTGPGTVLLVVSDEFVQNKLKDENKPWRLVVQIAAGELPPLGFDTEEDLDRALGELMRNGTLECVELGGHKTTFIRGTTGAIYMKMTEEKLLERTRIRMEEAIRAEESAPMSPPGRIVMPD